MMCDFIKPLSLNKKRTRVQIVFGKTGGRLKEFTVFSQNEKDRGELDTKKPARARFFVTGNDINRAQFNTLINLLIKECVREAGFGFCVTGAER